MVQLLPDQVGEPGRQLEEHLADSQVHSVGALVDIIVGQAGDRWHRQAEQECQCAAEPNVERQLGIVDASLELFGVLLIVQVWAGALGLATRDVQVRAQLPAGRPGEERRDFVPPWRPCGEPIVEAVLVDTVQRQTALLDPVEKVQRGENLSSGRLGRVVGQLSAFRSSAGLGQQVPVSERADEVSMVRPIGPLPICQ